MLQKVWHRVFLVLHLLDGIFNPVPHLLLRCYQSLNWLWLYCVNLETNFRTEKHNSLVFINESYSHFVCLHSVLCKFEANRDVCLLFGLHLPDVD